MKVFVKHLRYREHHIFKYYFKKKFRSLLIHDRTYKKIDEIWIKNCIQESMRKYLKENT